MAAEAVAESCVECCVDAVVEDCWPALSRHGRILCCLVTAAATLLAVAIGLAVVFGTATPVTATVEAASLSRLTVAADNNTSSNNNHTNYYYAALSLTVALRNPNVALRAIHSRPLGTGISVAGSHFGGGDSIRIADAGEVIRAKGKAEYNVEAAGEVMMPDGDGTAGNMLVQVEMGLDGEVTYRPFHRGRHAMRAMCTLQLQLLLPPPGFTTVAPVFQPVKCKSLKPAF